MRPYYDEGGIVIYHGDCLDVLPDVKADAAITDAPYGIADSALQLSSANRRGANRRGANNDYHPQSDWDRALNPAWAPACLAAAPVLAWFGHWRMREQVEQHAGMPARAEIVWAKDVHCGPPCPVARQDERIWLFSADGIKCKRFDTTVWSEPVIPTWSHRWHKNEKPLALMKRLIALLCAPGDRLVDPFMGSGTTLRAAKDLGVRAVGVDINERYCDVAARRLAQEVLFA